MLYVASTIDWGSALLGILILAVPFNEVMAPTYQTMGWMVVIALLIVAFAVAEGWLGSIFISRPLGRLSQTAKKLSQGDLTARAEIEGPLEIADLANTLNDMASRLQISLESLRAFAANASHELRTPLTSIKLQVEALRGNPIRRFPDGFPRWPRNSDPGFGLSKPDGLRNRLPQLPLYSLGCEAVYTFRRPSSR